MKPRILILTLMGVSTIGFAQAKIDFRDDALHLVYFDPNPGNLRPADAGLAGQAVPAGGILPSGVGLIVDLYAGTNSGSLSLVSSTTFAGSPTPGEWTVAHVTLPFGFFPFTTNFFQVQVHETFPTGYFGESPIFTAVGGAVVFPNLYQHSGPAFSTWPDGTYVLGPSEFGAIMLTIPEPGLMAMAALGIMVALYRRRRA